MSWSRYRVEFRSPRRLSSRTVSETGSSLGEVMVSTVILLVGLVGSAQILTISVEMHQLSRASTDATRLAQTKVEEPSKLNFATAPAVQITPVTPDPLAQNVANYFDVSPAGDFTRRWSVTAGPVARTRLVTIRVVPIRTGLRVAKPVELNTMIRQW